MIHQDFSSYPSDYPYIDSFHHSGPSHTSHQFTAVITVTRPALRESSPLVRLLQVLSQSPRLAAVILVWAGMGPPQVGWCKGRQAGRIDTALAGCKGYFLAVKY